MDYGWRAYFNNLICYKCVPAVVVREQTFYFSRTNWVSESDKLLNKNPHPQNQSKKGETEKKIRAPQFLKFTRNSNKK